MPANNGGPEHSGFLKRNSPLLEALLRQEQTRPLKATLSLLDEVTAILATGTTSNLIGGRSRRILYRIARLHTPKERANWDAKRWQRELGRSSAFRPQTATILATLYPKLARRKDFPSLISMTKRDRQSWERLFASVGADASDAGVVTALAIDRWQLPSGSRFATFYRRLGIKADEKGVPDRLAVYPEQIPALKWALARVAIDQCKPEITPGESACAACPLQRFCLAYRDAKRKANPTSSGPRSLTFIDVFAGGGGLSQGLTQAGLHLRAAVEWDQHAADTLYFNHPEINSNGIRTEDIRTVLEKDDCPEAFKGVDIVAGGPPCQPFSMARRHSNADTKDPRRHLFEAFMELVRRVNPRLVLMENVAGIKSAAKGKTIDAIKERLSDLGFESVCVDLDAADFGVPQHRHRVFFIGVSRTRVPKTREVLAAAMKHLEDHSLKSKPLPVKEALSGIPYLEPAKGGLVIRRSTRGKRTAYGRRMQPRGRFIYNHETRPHNPRDLAIFHDLKQGDTARDLEARDPNRIPYQLDSFGDKYRRLHGSRPAPTIPAHLRRDANSFVHPYVGRGITPREAARLQSFPDNYVFMGGFGSAFTQVGNAVPPLLAQAVGRSLKAALEYV